MQLNPYLNFNGNAAEAMKFYQSALGGELKMQTFGESGFKGPGEERIMHADLRGGSLTLMASDGRPDMNISFGDSVHLSLTGPAADKEQLTAAFNQLSAGGKIGMPLAAAPWGDTFGMFTDKFGINWMVNISQK